MNGIIVEYIIFYTRRARSVNNLEHNRDTLQVSATCI